jgi:DNA-binding transcriptional LysR family regulator
MLIMARSLGLDMTVDNAHRDQLIIPIIGIISASVDRLAAMDAFSRVARLGSFTRAARELRISTTAASRRVADLEEHLGVQLLERNTRRLRLTEVGAAILERCDRLLDDLAELESATSREGAVRGALRVTTGVDFGRDHLARLVSEFQDDHPHARIELQLTDHFVDLVAEGLDVAVRMGTLRDSTLVARRLGASRLVLVASPAYLGAHPPLSHPRELGEHACILDTNGAPRWTFEGPDGPVTFTPSPRIAVNSPSVTCDLVRRGRGISAVPRFAVADDLRAGRLVVPLPEYAMREIPLHAVFPPGRRLSTRVRAFVDFLAQRFAGWEA